jgi:hypothetical protein|tara:strand:- start:671 stop:931 length:261 start_codon:yes stop_codon:yes gene_type:complete
VYTKKIFFFLIGLGIISCSSDDSRCGNIIDKQIINGKYYFIFDVNSDIFNTNNNDNNSYIPDNSVSGEVSSADFDKFSIGQEYCSE